MSSAIKGRIYVDKIDTECWTQLTQHTYSLGERSIKKVGVSKKFLYNPNRFLLTKFQSSVCTDNGLPPRDRCCFPWSSFVWLELSLTFQTLLSSSAKKTCSPTAWTRWITRAKSFKTLSTSTSRPPSRTISPGEDRTSTEKLVRFFQFSFHCATALQI